MAEYIEREAAIKAVEEADVMCDIPADTYRVLMRYVERIPAADVRPVVPGKWIVSRTDYGWNSAEFPTHCKCSECGREVPYQDRDKFCPNCGAEMEVEHEA